MAHGFLKEKRVKVRQAHYITFLNCFNQRGGGGGHGGWKNRRIGMEGLWNAVEERAKIVGLKGWKVAELSKQR